MATITKEFLSESTSGRGIEVVADATPGTTIHTAHATAKDEVWIWASNTHTSDLALTVEFGGATDPDDLFKVSIAAGETELVVPGVCISGGLDVAAFAGTASKIAVFGYVNRIA
jgi:hypothetical protein